MDGNYRNRIPDRDAILRSIKEFLGTEEVYAHGKDFNAGRAKGKHIALHTIEKAVLSGSRLLMGGSGK